MRANATAVAGRLPIPRRAPGRGASRRAASRRAAAWLAAGVGAAVLSAHDARAELRVSTGAPRSQTTAERLPAEASSGDRWPVRFGDIEARVKWYSTARSLPARDGQRRASGKSTTVDHHADLRLMWRREAGPLSLNVHHSTTWLEGDTLAGTSPGLAFDQTPTGDERRLIDLTWNVEESAGRRILHRFDRLAAEYRTEGWRVTLGREAVGWGGGFFFQPMDLFSPFAPTTIDQDYPAGDDLLLVERLFESGSELQAVAVGRRGRDGKRGWDSSSVAARYRGHVGENEIELMASRHHGDPVFGVGVRIPAGGALLRSDLTWTRAEDGAVVSGLVNADCTFAVKGTPVYVFGEYFHNGFGVARLPGDLGRLPAPLVDRVGRGEAFNLMRNYLAAGTTFRWNYLLSQSLSVIANLHDASLVTVAHLTWNTSDASSLQTGITASLGDTGDEFGGVAVGEGLTVGGGERAFVRFVYHF